MGRRFLVALGFALAASAGGAGGAAGAAAAREAGPAIALGRVEAPALARGATVRLTLSPEVAPSWAEANVGLLAVRSPGLQRRLDSSKAGAELEVPLPDSGCALLFGDLGRPEDRGFADSWHRSRRSVKAVLCRDSGSPVIDLAARRRAASLLIAKAGTRDEVRPMANPATTRPGADLPVRVYADGRDAAGVRVVAEGPGGISSVATSDESGFAVVALPVAGPWRIHFRAGEQRVAELLFEVPEAALHEEGR
jgi:hypothetical protein